MKRKLYQASIRRDQSTTTPVTVPAHEVPILNELHGTENVTVQDKPVGEHEPVENDGVTEYRRLVNKYGPAIVEKVYGTEASRGLDSALDYAGEGTDKSHGVNINRPGAPDYDLSPHNPQANPNPSFTDYDPKRNPEPGDPQANPNPKFTDPTDETDKKNTKKNPGRADNKPGQPE